MKVLCILAILTGLWGVYGFWGKDWDAVRFAASFAGMSLVALRQAL